MLFLYFRTRICYVFIYIFHSTKERLRALLPIFHVYGILRRVYEYLNAFDPLLLSGRKGISTLNKIQNSQVGGSVLSDMEKLGNLLYI